MSFKENLEKMPSIEQLSGLDIIDAHGEIIHNIPAVEGKLGSLKLYNALAVQFAGKLDAAAAEQGLAWFAEHVADAEQNVGKHPNIDLLIKVKQNQLVYTLQPRLK